MPSVPNNRPPRWAERFLEWYCRPELLEDLHGDLNEYFNRNLERKGRRYARVIYVIDVLKFLRPYTLSKPDFLKLLISWIMIGSYIKTSGRNIIRNKLFSAINIIGLAASLSVGLLMISFIGDLLSYDQFDKNRNRIYRVIDEYHYLDQPVNYLASTSIETGRKIHESIPGIEDMVIMRKPFGGDFQYGENVLSLNGMWADTSFFNIFSYIMIKGNPKTALKDPNSIVLTKSAAIKLFGDEDPMGKTLVMSNDRYFSKSNGNYQVTGVIRDPSKFSHMRFEALCSFSTLYNLHKDNEDIWKWTSIWQNYVYLLLPENCDISQLQSNLTRLSEKENNQLPDHHTRIILGLQPLSKIMTDKDLKNQIGPTLPNIALWLLSGLTIIVLISACFNYTNLSIARSIRRSKEVGIRKVIGAQKNQVLLQFIAESVFIALIALMIGFAIYLLIRPGFLSLTPEIADLVSLDFSLKTFFMFILLAVATGLIAGILPAVFYSGINAIQVMKSASSSRIFRHVNFRKALITIQFTFSLIFITSTLIIYRQYKNFISFDLGFNTSNVLNINIAGNKFDIVEKELSAIPEITEMSRSIMIPSLGWYYGNNVKYVDPDDSTDVWYNNVDENYIPVLNHKIIAGKNFTPKPDGIESDQVIVNEQLIKRFNIGSNNPQKAIGEFINIEHKKFQIIGVVKDFHYGRVDSKIEPFFFRYTNKDLDYINAKIVSTDLPVTMNKIEKSWKKIDRVHPFDAKFYDDQIQQAYSEFAAMIRTMGFMAFLAIVISSMGLLGMVVFSTQTRIREISIRKVFGAGFSNLIYLLCRSFLFLLVLSAAIAIPFTYIFFNRVVLRNYAYHMPIGVFELFSGSVSILLIALILIASQTFKVAHANPAEVLKNE